ncbi:MAG: DUF1345 domain-containing protein [Chthoniobacterales bacterium]
MTEKASAPRRRLNVIGRLDAQHRQWIALPLAIAAGFLLPGDTPLTCFINAWDVYATILLMLAWVSIVTGDPAHAHRNAQLQDPGRILIFAFVLIGVCMSVLAVVFTLHAQKEAGVTERSLHLGQTLFTVLASWTLVHTLFTLHYAHVFYRGESAKPPRIGLDIPGEKTPDYLDFAYFSFVIGATAQTSDIGITSPEMRRLALLHGVLSFLFNTFILALSINMLASLL